MQDQTETLDALRRRLDEAETYLRVQHLRAQQTALQEQAARPDLWDDPEAAKQVNQELAGVSEDLEVFDRLAVALDDASTLYELAVEEGDESLDGEIAASIAALEDQFADLELRALFTGEYDDKDAVCHIQAGEGGTDAQDWAEILLRMYSRWAENHGFKVEIDDISEGQEAGITSAEFIVRGRRAYGLLQAEHGVHRLVRISPFNKEGKRQTAFASMTVAPFFEEVVDQVDIDETDLRVDTYRSSGAGGQHVNTTDSAVRITHLPTGIVVSCQNERSQHQNRDRAMQMLAAKLLDLERKKREAELAAITGDEVRVGFGSQIRSYVKQPYQMVKDLRSSIEIGNVDGVLDGDLDQLIEGYLRWARSQRVG